MEVNKSWIPKCIDFMKKIKVDGIISDYPDRI